jgi:hypothetical protein
MSIKEEGAVSPTPLGSPVQPACSTTAESAVTKALALARLVNEPDVEQTQGQTAPAMPPDSDVEDGTAAHAVNSRLARTTAAAMPPMPPDSDVEDGTVANAVHSRLARTTPGGAMEVQGVRGPQQVERADTVGRATPDSSFLHSAPLPSAMVSTLTPAANTPLVCADLPAMSDWWWLLVRGRLISSASCGSSGRRSRRRWNTWRWVASTVCVRALACALQVASGPYSCMCVGGIASQAMWIQQAWRGFTVRNAWRNKTAALITEYNQVRGPQGSHEVAPSAWLGRTRCMCSSFGP